MFPVLLFAAFLTPAHLDQAQVEAAIDHSHIQVLVRELQTAQCPSGIPHFAEVSFGAAPADSPADPYDTWVETVAAHIQSNQAFGADYAATSAAAYTEVYNIWYDCAKHIHDADELALRANETPEVVGEELRALFAGDDADTRRRAAEYLLGHYR